MTAAAARFVAVLALAGAGFAVGSALAPSHSGDSTTPSVTTAAAVRPVVNAPDAAPRVPALARSKHPAKRTKKKPSDSTTTAAQTQPSAAIAGTTPTRHTPAIAAPVTKTQTQTQPQQQPTTGTTTSPEPPPFDEHTQSTP